MNKRDRHRHRRARSRTPLSKWASVLSVLALMQQHHHHNGGMVHGQNITNAPTGSPSSSPTLVPTTAPTKSPSASPSASPSNVPTPAPITAAPSGPDPTPTPTTVAPASIAPTITPPSTSSISGYAFFDSDSDGTRDPTNTLDYGIYDISVYLFTCTNDIQKTTKTDVRGKYTLEGLSPDTEYYISVPEVPSWYIFTNVWNGARDETTGERLYGMETSVIDPVTKSSECFTVGGNDGSGDGNGNGLEDVNFGMKFDIPSEPDTPPPTNAVTPPPTNAVTPPPTTTVTPPPTMAITPPPTTSQPTLKPTTAPVTPPPTTSAPSKQLTLTPTTSSPTLKPTSSPTIKPTTYTPTTSNSPTYPPEKSVTIGGYVFRDTNNNGYYEETMGESRMSNVRVSLTTCVVNNAAVGSSSSIANPSLIPQVLARARTDSSGYYKFGNAVPAGEYSVTFHYCVNQIIIGSGGGGGGVTDDTTGFAANPCYTGSKIWTGSVYEGTDVCSNLDADSNANPATGATVCRSYGEGEEDLDINAGMLYVPRTGAPTVSLSPSEAPVTSMPIVPGSTRAPTGVPTGRPTVAVTASPSVGPSISLSVSPSVSPSVVSSEEPSASPSLAPSVSADPSASPSASPSMSAQPSGSPSVTPSTTPSAKPTPVASDSPSVAPTVDPSARPSSNPTTSFPPTRTEYGPETTENLVMNIRGIDAIEDEKAWEDVTAQHVMDFFNIDNPNEKAFDVTAQIDVTDQSAGSFGRRARDLVEVRVRTRALQTGKNLEVTYTQRSLWKTPEDPTLVNGEYIASKPFATRVAIESYISSLKALSPYYDDITSIGSIRIDPPAPAPVEKTPPPKEDDKTMLYIIIGVCCGGALLLFIIGAFIYRRRKKRRENEYLEEVGNGPRSSMRDLESGAGGPVVDSGGSGSMSSSSSGNSSNIKSESSASASYSSQDSATRGDTVSALIAKARTGSEEMINVIAPAGKLGVIVDTPPEGGPAYVCEIKDTCPIIDQIHLEDKIIAVDDEDVQQMTAVNVSKLLARRARNPERKITVLREKDSFSSNVSSGSRGGAAPLTTSPSGESVTSAEAVKPDYDNKDEWLHINAPEGKLGVVLVTPEPPESGPAYVFNIRDDSPLVGKVHLGDKVMAVDDEDVREMTAINVSKLLGSKSNNKDRKISVYRDSGASSSMGGSIVEPTLPSASQDSSTDKDGSGGSSHESSQNESAAGSSAAAPSSSEQRMEIIAPAGKLGVVVDSPPEGGSAYVSDIKEESPIRGEIRLGDKIMLVDGEDVSKLKAIHVSMLLGSKSRNPKRTLTISREVDE